MAPLRFGMGALTLTGKTRPLYSCCPSVLSPLPGESMAFAIALPHHSAQPHSRILRCQRLQMDHATRAVAVQHGQRSANNPYRLHLIQHNAGQLSLPIRGTQRDAVEQQVDAAYSESGAGTEAAQGQPGILGVVGAAVRLDTGQSL